MDETTLDQINPTVTPEIKPVKNWKTPFIIASGFTCVLLICVIYLLTIGRKTDIPCGGFVGSQCPLGYSCNYENNYPDALGYCVKNIFSLNQKKSTPTPTRSPSPTPTIQPTIAQESTSTANWKTYTNSMFSIKYPADFQVDELGTGINFINKTMNIRIVLKFEGTLLNINDYIDQKSWCTSIKSNTGTPYLLDSVSSLRYEKTPCGLTGSTDIYSLYNGTAYHISIDTQENYTENIPLINQILSTFKFLNQTQTDMTNWKIYTDGKYFSVKYPIKFALKPTTNGMGLWLIDNNKEMEKVSIIRNFMGGWACTKIVSSEDISIDQEKGKIDIHATMLDSDNCSTIDPNGDHFAVLFINHNNTRWFFRYQIDKTQEKDEIIEFKTILSTFKFL